MATLQKLRKNKITPIAIGVAMLLFVVTLFLKQGGSQGERNAAVLNGKELDIAKFNEMVEEAKDVFVTMGQLPENPDNQTMTQLREMVYQNYISSQMLEEECERLGITVTTAELQNIIKNGSNQVLMQTPFRTQQGTFDYASLQQFLKQYKDMQKNSAQIPAEQREYFERIYRMWIYTEKELRKSVLMEKYQVLLGSLILSNPVSAKAAFEARNNETDVLLAALPYTSIEDKDVKVEESDVKAKYEEYKDFFFRPSQTRDIKYIDVVIKASKEDEEALNKDMAEYAAQLRDSSLSVENVVRRSQSSISYSALPLSKKAFPRDIAARFDSMAVGAQCAPYYNAADNTMNIIKMMGKVMRPDSVEVREIAATGKDLAAAKKTADSIYNALQAGANFDTIAKAYNQPATKHWITSNMYEGSQINEDNRKYLEVVTTAAANSINKIELGAGVIILEVTDRRHVEEKYNVAVIKREMSFSNKTTNDNFNKLSTFIASHKTIKEMEENSKGEFSILPCNEFNAMTAAVPGIEESREVIRWAYNEETKVGDVSEIFYCGKKREHLVVAVLEAIHEEGYADYKEEAVSNSLRQMVINDKKAVMLQEKMINAKSVADVAKIAGAVQDTVQHITFGAQAFIQKTASSEPAVSGAVSAAAKGTFMAGVKGNAGVFAFQVLGKNVKEKYDAKKNEKEEMQRAAQQQAYMVFSGQNDLRNPCNLFYNNFKKAEKKDNRHLFF